MSLSQSKRAPYVRYLSLLQVSTVHVYLSYPFVLSWSLMEALAASCLIIASRTPAIEEVIEDGYKGLLVDFFNHAHLALPIDAAFKNATSASRVAERDQKAVVRRERDQPARRMTLAPAVDVFEDSQGIMLWADLPGVTKDKLDVKVHDGNLYIEAEAVVPTPDGLRLQHAEIREPHFARAFSLSPDFDTSKIDANLQDGMLKLTIPRRDEVRPRRIEVQTN